MTLALCITLYLFIGLYVALRVFSPFSWAVVAAWPFFLLMIALIG